MDVIVRYDKVVNIGYIEHEGNVATFRKDYFSNSYEFQGLDFMSKQKAVSIIKEYLKRMSNT